MIKDEPSSKLVITYVNLVTGYDMNHKLNYFRAFFAERRIILAPEYNEKQARVARSFLRSDVPYRRSDILSNAQGFPYLNEWVRINELSHEHIIQLD